MFRRQRLPSACLTIALGAAALVASVPSLSQDLSTEERFDRLERDLNMLQRQVYRGAPPSAISGDTGAAVDVEVRMERIEQQMRELTGRVEEVGNRVEQLHQRIEQVNGDIDMRLGQAPPGPGPQTAAVPPGPPPPGQPDMTAPPPVAPPFSPGTPGGPGDTLTPPATASGPPPPDATRGPTPIFGTLTPPGSAPPPGSLPPRGLASAAPSAKAPLPGGSPAEQYDYAFGLVKKANYPAAEAAFRAFIERHPKDRLAGSARYLLGDTYFQRGRYIEAATAFADAYKHDPKGPRAPDDLLKLSMSLARANQKQNACLALTQLDHDFPRPAIAIKERALAERRRLGC
jgi:tol-pal system protein YbgF